MGRAEIRRQNKQNEKSKKLYQLTAEDLERIKQQEREKAAEHFRQKYKSLARETFEMMLGIPTNILIADYWTKTAEKRIPEFVEKCLSLYDAACGDYDVVKIEEILALTEQYGKVKLADRNSDIGKVVYSKKFGAD